MPKQVISFRVELGFDQWLAQVDQGLVKVVDKTLDNVLIASEARVPKKTTATQRSHYKVTENGSGAEEAMADARSVKPEVQFAGEQDPVPRHLQGFAIVSTDYAAALEYGGGSSKTGDIPYFTPSVDEQDEPFIKACNEVISSAKGL